MLLGKRFLKNPYSTKKVQLRRDYEKNCATAAKNNRGALALQHKSYPGKSKASYY
jgi:hypothetical protein